LADYIMSLAHVRHFPVLDGDKIADVINPLGLLYASMASLVHSPKAASPREALGMIAVKDAMKLITTVAKETTIRDAARTMVARTIEYLLMMDSNRLAGLVSRTDLLRGTCQEIKGNGGWYDRWKPHD
jgi:CBS domain-containing protein